MGSAFKNKGVQLLLNGVGSYLPAPNEVDNYALDISRKEEKVPLESDHKKPFVGLAFKLEDGKASFADPPFRSLRPADLPARLPGYPREGRDAQQLRGRQACQDLSPRPHALQRDGGNQQHRPR